MRRSKKLIYSITSSARASSIGGTSRPRARTVKLIFQPAEEEPPLGEEGGARLMVKEGACDWSSIAGKRQSKTHSRVKDILRLNVFHGLLKYVRNNLSYPIRI